MYVGKVNCLIQITFFTLLFSKDPQNREFDNPEHFHAIRDQSELDIRFTGQKDMDVSTQQKIQVH